MSAVHCSDYTKLFCPRKWWFPMIVLVKVNVIITHQWCMRANSLLTALNILIRDQHMLNCVLAVKYVCCCDAPSFCVELLQREVVFNVCVQSVRQSVVAWVCHVTLQRVFWACSTFEVILEFSRLYLSMFYIVAVIIDICILFHNHVNKRERDTFKETKKMLALNQN